jgi:hypothetical protein
MSLTARDLVPRPKSIIICEGFQGKKAAGVIEEKHELRILVMEYNTSRCTILVAAELWSSSGGGHPF